jgi:hypothetical protein
MSPFQSVSLDRFPGPGDPEATAEARREATFYGSIVSAATAWPFVGTQWHSALPCRRRPQAAACEGRLAVVHTEVPPEVRWRCPVCGDAGMIRAFAGSSWDLGSTETPTDLEPARVDVPMAPADLAVLRSLDGLGTPDRRTVMTALDRGPEEVVVWGAPEALWRLLEAVRAAARRESDRRRAALTRIAVAIEAALVQVA